MEDEFPALKLAIPRLKQNGTLRYEQQHQSRVRRACTNCRERKVRCTGESRCRNCVEQDATCIYTKGRRDRLNEVMKQNNDLINLLKDLSTHVDDLGKRMIDKQLNNPRKDGHIPIPATEREAETLGVPGKRPRKRTLSHESNQTHNMLGTDISESDNGNDSSMIVTPEPGPRLTVQYPTSAIGSVGTQNFGNLQYSPDLEFNPGLTLDANVPLLLTFGDTFLVNLNQPGMTVDDYVTGTHADSDSVIQMYNDCKEMM